MVNWKIGVLIGALATAAFTLLPFSKAGLIAATPQQSYASNVQLHAKRSSADFVPDGDSSKLAWKQAKWAEFDNDAAGNSHFPEILTRVASVWTETQIYFFFWCRYDSLNVYQGEDPKAERWQLWDRDVVEVFLNPQPERMNFFRAAGNGGDDRRKFLAWSIIPEGKTFHVPARFGLLRLVK